MLDLFKQFQDDILIRSEVLDVLFFEGFDLLFVAFGSFDELGEFVELLIGDFVLAVFGEFGGNFGFEEVDSELAEVLCEGFESVGVVVEKVVAHHGAEGFSFLLHAELIAGG